VSIWTRGRGRGRPCRPWLWCTTLGPANWIPPFVPLVYFRALHPALPVVALRVLGALAARQIDQDQLSSQLVVPLTDNYLANGVGAGTGIVGNCGVGGSIGVCLLHNSQQIFGGFCVFFSEAWNLYISIFVLEDVEHAFLIQ
jgi:hypothetical protein